MAKTTWTKNTAEFRVKWADRRNLDGDELSDMLSDIVAILQELENTKAPQIKIGEK